MAEPAGPAVEGPTLESGRRVGKIRMLVSGRGCGVLLCRWRAGEEGAVGVGGSCLSTRELPWTCVATLELPYTRVATLDSVRAG